jgi:hypothetical protein
MARPSASAGRAAARPAGAGGAAGAAGAGAALASPAGAAPPSFLKRDGASSGMVSPGCSVRARTSSTSCVSGMSGFGTQQSTGHTAAHASWSWKPTHSVHFSGTM